MSSDEEKVPWPKRLWRKVTDAFGRAWGWLGRRLSALWNNLPAMWGVTILAALFTATYVTYLSGLPWRLEWDSGASRQCHVGTFFLKRCWQFEPLAMDDRLKVAAGVITGIAALTALLVSYRKQLNLESTQFDDDLAKAVNQLAHTSPTVRIAGVYAVAGLADRTHARRQECVDVLCGYLRVPCSLDPKDTALESVVEAHFSDSGNLVERTTQYTPYDKEVRNTIVRIMNNHLQQDARKSWSDLKFDFTGAHLFEADFTGARFAEVSFNDAVVAGSAWFNNSSFVRKAYFVGTVFTQDAWFLYTSFAQGAVFIDSIFTKVTWCLGATFTEDASFVQAKFSQFAHFDRTTFVQDAWFSGAAFAQTADFSDASFAQYSWFDSARFSVEPHFTKEQFSQRPNFTRATLNGEPFDPFPVPEKDPSPTTADTTDLRPFDEPAEESPQSD